MRCSRSRPAADRLGTIQVAASLGNIGDSAGADDADGHTLRSPATDRYARAVVQALDLAGRYVDLVALRVLNRRHEDLGRRFDRGLGVVGQHELARIDVERHAHRLAGDAPRVGTRKTLDRT